MFGTTTVCCLSLQTILGSLVVANRAQITTCLNVFITSRFTVPKIDVNVIKWNAENSLTVEQFWLCLDSQIRPEGGLD